MGDLRGYMQDEFIQEAVAEYNADLLDGEEPISEEEMAGILEEKMGKRGNEKAGREYLVFEDDGSMDEEAMRQEENKALRLELARIQKDYELLKTEVEYAGRLYGVNWNVVRSLKAYSK